MKFRYKSELTRADIGCACSPADVARLVPAVRVVLGTHELGGRRDEAERETRRILSGAGQF